MEMKRLFIGGLYSDIKEVDLRDRLKTFGTVSSVEIIRRTDEKGCPIKTFAYIDMLQTESDFRKCVSLLSNSKWKGCCLKIQAAKESFLIRLERERQKDQTNMLPPLQNGTKEDIETVEKTCHEQKTPKQNAIPETLPKAVPGTPLPGKKNWVVGKFGRVLPVVYLRRKDRKKIAKFDPSKTTHCLRKIKPEELNTAVSQLTWSLESEREIASRTPRTLMQMKGKKQRKSKLKDVDSTEVDFDVGNGLERYEKKASAVTLKGNFVPFPSASHTKGRSVDAKGDLDSDSSASLSESDTDNCHRSARLKGNTLSSTEGHSSNTFDSSTSSMSPSRDDFPVSTSSKKNSVVEEKSKVNVLSNKSEVQRASCTKIKNENNNVTGSLVSPNISRVQLEDDKNCSDEKSSIPSDGNSSDRSVETSDMESSENEIVIKRSKDQLSQEIATKLMKEVSLDPMDNSDRLLVRSPKTKDESKATDNPHKQKHSNEKRLDALKDKKMTVLAQRNLIKDALKDLDSGTQSHDGKKHIVFSDNDDDDVSCDDVKEKAAYTIGDKISGSKASSWLGLDSDSDGSHDQGDNDNDKSDHLVTVKPHFEGKAGEQLFKLQRTFGGDRRFELDSRFLESEDEEVSNSRDNVGGHDEQAVNSDAKALLSESNSETIHPQNGDEISRSLTEEKEVAMKVLRNIFGGNFKADHSSRESQEKNPTFRNSSVVHYDPAREDHKQFEQTASVETEQEPEPAFVDEKQREDPVLPDVSQDKYYDANMSSLAELFGNKKQGTTFTFLSQDTEDDADITLDEHSQVGAVGKITTNPWQPTAKLPYDSSDDDDGDDAGDDVDFEGIGLQSGKATSQLDELFFFHPGDPELENRINDQEAPFIRTGSEEEVSEYWVKVRSDLTQDYKRKRKDAVRRQNKLAAKRIRHR